MKKAALASGMRLHQKGLCVFLLLPAILALPQIFGPKNFLPNLEVSDFSVYLSAALAMVVSLWTGYLFHIGKLNPDPEWQSFGRARKCFMIIGSPLLLWAVYHSAIGYSLPRLWTMLDSETRTIKYQVTREWGGGRYSCDYQLTNDHLDRWSFEVCVSKELFYRLPAGRPFIATFGVEQSSLGMTFKETRIHKKTLTNELSGQQ